MAPPVEQIIPDSQIGPYTVLRLLGAGGMGQVYLARHRHLGRDAAVKVLLPQISMDETVVARFFTEARATAQLRHPNIVEVFDCDVLPDGRAYIVMEYLQGESLRTTLDRVTRLAPDYASIAAITGLVADALQAAHTNGIVHRDLKPDNTYLTIPPNQRDQLTIKVLDFGIAKLVSAGNTGGATRTGSLLGTPLYMSPEQCRGLSNIDHRSDVYSLGCMVFEMVAGRPPFVFEAPGDMLMAHMAQDAPELSSLQPDVPPEIERLVAQMLVKDPAGRPQSMAQVAEELAAFLGLGIAELTTALQRPPGFAGVSAGSTAILTPEQASGPRRTPAPPRRTPAPGGSHSSRDAKTPDATAKLPSSVRPGVLSERRRISTTTQRPSRSRWVLWAGIPVGLALVAGAVFLLTRPEPAPVAPKAATAPAPVPVAPRAPAAVAKAAAPARVELQINTEPSGAEIWLEGEDSGRGVTPRRLVLPRSDAALAITLKADGHVTKTITVDASRDRTVDVVLEPSKTARSRKGGRKSASGNDEGKRSAEDEAAVQFKAVGD